MITTYQSGRLVEATISDMCDSNHGYGITVVFSDTM
jgi:hypothetical protein